MNNYCLEVIRQDLTQTRTIELPSPNALTLAHGEAVISVKRFGRTANNIIYGVTGDIIGYWQFFPAEGDYGRIPVWGIGTVTDPSKTDLKACDKYYGYYPMESYLVVKPEHLTTCGFNDGAKHRGALPPTYNQYSLMTPANGFDRDYDSHRIVYYPLFITGLVLDDYLFDHHFFNADKIILSSASSKTSLSLAFLLDRNRDRHVVGLTSSGNKDFVESMSIFDEIVTYDTVQTMDASSKIAYIDMVGNQTVLGNVHHHFSDKVTYSCGAGITHWHSSDGAEPSSLPGAKPTMFFAPTQIQKRHKEWGPKKLQAEMQNAWTEFLRSVDSWIMINERKGPSEMQTTYQELLQGASPDQSFAISL